MCEKELSDFISISPLPGTLEVVVDEKDSYKWNHASTLVLLDLYKEHRKKVGSLRIKSFKKMFELIAQELQKQVSKNITAANCENRWKHLERSYKKYIDTITKTGRGRKDFEYSNEMHDILGKKKNIHPLILLSSNTEAEMPNKENVPELEDTVENENTLNKQDERVLEDSARKNSVQIKKPTYKTRNMRADVLREIRYERQEYYRKRLEIEERNIQVKTEKNKILEERNNILKQLLEKNIKLSATDILQ